MEGMSSFVPRRTKSSTSSKAEFRESKRGQATALFLFAPAFGEVLPGDAKVSAVEPEILPSQREKAQHPHVLLGAVTKLPPFASIMCPG